MANNESNLPGEASSRLRTAIASATTGQAMSAERLFRVRENLATTLFERFETAHNHADLDEAIELTRLLLDDIQPNMPLPPHQVYKLGLMKSRRWALNGCLRELDEVVFLGRQAKAGLKVTHPAMTAILSLLEFALTNRYNDTGEMEDLDEAVDCARHGIRVTKKNSKDQMSHTQALISTLCARYKKTNSTSDRDEALKLNSLMLSSSKPGTKLHFIALRTLSEFVTAKFEESGQPQDMEYAMQVTKRALDNIASEDKNQHQLLGRLAGLHMRLYDRTHTISDLREGVNYSDKALSTIPSSCRTFESALLNHLSILRELCLETSDLAEIDRLISRSKHFRSLSFSKAQSPLEAENIHGDLLSRRYYLSAEISDLIQILEHAKGFAAAATSKAPREGEKLVGADIRALEQLLDKASKLSTGGKEDTVADQIRGLLHKDFRSMWRKDGFCSSLIAIEIEEGPDDTGILAESKPSGSSDEGDPSSERTESKESVQTRSRGAETQAARVERSPKVSRSTTQGHTPQRDQAHIKGGDLVMRAKKPPRTLHRYKNNESYTTDKAKDSVGDSVCHRHAFSECVRSVKDKIAVSGNFWRLSPEIRELRHLQDAIKNANEAFETAVSFINSTLAKYEAETSMTSLRLRSCRPKEQRPAMSAGEIDIELDLIADVAAKYANLLRDRYKRTKSLDDLNLSEKIAEQGIALYNKAEVDTLLLSMKNHITPQGFVPLNGHIRAKHAAAETSRVKFLLANGSVKDLKAGIQNVHDALQIARRVPTCSKVLVARMTSELAMLLRARVRATGLVTDIDSAISDGSQFLDDTKADKAVPTRTRVTLMGNLGLLYSSKFEVTGSLEDAQKALAFARDARENIPTGDATFKIDMNLANALHSIYLATHELSYITEAANVIRTAMAQAPSASAANDPYIINATAVLLSSHSTDPANDDDLKEALDLGRRLREVCPENLFMRYRTLSILGSVFEACYRCYREPQYLQKCMASYQEVWSSGKAEPICRLSSALKAARLITDTQGSAAGAETAMQALDGIKAFPIATGSNGKWTRLFQDLQTYIPASAQAKTINTAASQRVVSDTKSGPKAIAV